MSTCNSNHNNKNKHRSTTHRIVKEIGYFNSGSKSINYLQKLNLFSGAFNNEILFKQLIGHLTLTICKYPYNASLILNLSIPLSMYRATMMDKFRKLDHILSIVIKPLDVTHKALKTRYKNCNYKDIVAHYTRYQYINNDNFSCGNFIRKNILGINSNLEQFLLSIRDHLANDNCQFLTISAIQLNDKDIDLLCCRYFSICEALILFRFGHEILIDESRYYRDILNYFIKFIKYLFKLNKIGLHSKFHGLKNDHLKLLISATVLLEIGFKTEKPIYRLHLNVNKESNKFLETKLRQLNITNDNKNYFKLKKQIVHLTPGSKNIHFRKDIDKYFEQIYKLFKDFFISQPMS